MLYTHLYLKLSYQLNEVSNHAYTALQYLVCSVGVQSVHGNEVPCKGCMAIERGEMQRIPSIVDLDNWRQSSYALAVWSSD